MPPAIIPALIGAGGVFLGVVLSWLLGQASAHFAAERDRRARLRAVLGELLEIRHRLLVQPKVADPLDGIGKLLPASLQAGFGTVSPEDRKLLDGLRTQVVPDAAALEERYDRSIAALACVDPMLYYQLRNKETSLRLGVALQDLIQRTGGPPMVAAALHQLLAEELVPDLDRAILNVGSRAASVVTGFWRRRELRRILQRNPASDEDVRKVLERMLARLVELLGGPGGAPHS